MEKKEIHCKFTYKCGICGKEHQNVLDRAKCEIACTERAEAEAKKKAEEKMADDKKMRKAAIDESIKRTAEMIDSFVSDYGHYEYNDVEPIPNLFWLEKIWNIL